MKNYLHVFNDSADRLVDRLNEFVDSQKPIRLLDFLNYTTLDVICQAGFSKQVNDIENSKFYSAISTALCAMAESFRDPFMMLKPWKKAIL